MPKSDRRANGHERTASGFWLQLGAPWDGPAVSTTDAYIQVIDDDGPGSPAPVPGPPAPALGRGPGGGGSGAGLLLLAVPFLGLAGKRWPNHTRGVVKMNTLRTRAAAGFCAALIGMGAVMSVAEATGDELGTRVTWKRIVGGYGDGELVGRPASDICELFVECLPTGPAAWSVTQGRAEVNLESGLVKFFIRGLAVAGDPSFANIGTTSIATKVKGTVFCNDTQPGVPEWADTPAVRLSPQGNASFHGRVDLPASCLAEPDDVVFLVRIAQSDPPSFLEELWVAFGAVRLIGPVGGD